MLVGIDPFGAKEPRNGLAKDNLLALQATLTIVCAVTSAAPRLADPVVWRPGVPSEESKSC